MKCCICNKEISNETAIDECLTIINWKSFKYCSHTCKEVNYNIQKFLKWIDIAIKYEGNYERLYEDLDANGTEAKQRRLLGFVTTSSVCNLKNGRTMSSIPSPKLFRRMYLHYLSCGMCVKIEQCDSCDKCFTRKLF